jgi:two-component system, LytTR family, response regulator
MIRCVAIDDEPLALNVIRQYTSDIPSLDLLGTYTDAIIAREYLKTHHVDLLFLDIQMPDINGIRLFESLSVKPIVIFTTAFSEFAVKGFDLAAIDYLVKPFSFDRFLLAIERVIKKLEPPIQPADHKEEFIVVKSEHHLVNIPCQEIGYIEGLDDYVKIHLRNDSRPVLSLITLKGILEKLPRDRFLRVHRSYIVPVHLIRSIHNRQVSLGFIDIPIGDTYLKAVQSWLLQH